MRKHCSLGITKILTIQLFKVYFANLLIFFLTVFSFLVFAQTKKIDSLKIVLKNDKRDLKEYVDIINYYTDQYSLDSLKKYTYLYHEDSKKSSVKEDYVESLLFLSNYYYLIKDQTKKDYYLRECINISKKYKFWRIWASCHIILARENYNKSQSKECIENSLKALGYYEKLGKKGAEVTEMIYAMLVLSYKNVGNLDAANKYLIKEKQIVKSANLKYKDKRIAQGEMAILDAKNKKDEALKISLKLISKLKTYDHDYLKNNGLTEEYFNIAYRFVERKNIDIAKKYLDSSKIYARKIGQANYDQLSSYYANLETEILLKEKKINQITLDSITKKITMSDEKFNVSKIHSLKGSYYKNKKDYEKSIAEFEIAKKKYFENGFKREYGDALSQLIELEILTQDSVSALKYFKEFSKNNETIFNDEVAASLSKADVLYQTELKEAKIENQQLEIEKQTANRNYALSGVAALLLLSGGGFLFYRNRKKREDLQKQNTMLSLQKNLNEMQLQNLNKQLNPHEIKNLLAGVSLEMQEKAPESYQNMVKLFNLTKASLYNDSLTESLDNQIKQAEDFIHLEKQMLFEPIDFKIEKNVNGNVEIPRLLVKNLLENSVKHGIKGKENGGTILLKVFEKENYIHIEVDDTGKGRKIAISQDSGIGTSTYIKLFETLNKTNDKKASFDILDKEIGTKVVVKIPKNYNYA